jgi:prephenate dehydrogenase
MTITRFGGGSFEDLARIAMPNVPVWTELFLKTGGNSSGGSNSLRAAWT